MEGAEVAAGGPRRDMRSHSQSESESEGTARSGSRADSIQMEVMDWEWQWFESWLEAGQWVGLSEGW